MSEDSKRSMYCVSNPAFKNIKMDTRYIMKFMDAVCRPGWHKNASGFAEAKELASTNQHTILLACVDYTGCCQYWSNCLKTEVFDQNEFGLWVFKKGLILVQLDCTSLLTNLATGDWNDSETANLILKYFLADQDPNSWSVDTAAAARIDSDGETCLGRVGVYTPGTGVMKWIADFENATQMNKAIFKIDKNLHAAPVILQK
jgi:hypothetical protein